MAEVDVLVREFAPHLETLPEFRAMQELSPAYHVTSCDRAADETRVRCRDLRIINFNTTFGSLDVVFGPQFEVRSVDLHV